MGAYEFSVCVSFRWRKNLDGYLQDESQSALTEGYSLATSAKNVSKSKVHTSCLVQFIFSYLLYIKLWFLLTCKFVEFMFWSSSNREQKASAHCVVAITCSISQYYQHTHKTHIHTPEQNPCVRVVINHDVSVCRNCIQTQKSWESKFQKMPPNCN